MKSVVKRRILFACNLLVVFLFTSSCEKEEVNPEIYFPVGRISVLNNNLAVKTNNQELSYELVYDNCGGYWLKFNSTQLKDNSEVIVDFTRTNQQTENFADSTHLENWLKASYYIDCDKKVIKNKALEITEGLNTNLEKAKAIQQYVIGHIVYTEHYHKPGDVKASKTLDEGIGVCMNFSRLYVALCRASGVPARSIWGIVYGNNDGTYHYHHQWAEACDEDGMWHTCDLTYSRVFFNNNMKYLDLVYGAEENSTITGNTEWISLLNDMDYWHNYPVACAGRLQGFKMVSDNRPDSMVVEYAIQF